MDDRLSVLVIEDHREMRATIAQFLKATADLVVDRAVGSAEEALSALDSRSAPPPPDLVLLDLSLPGRNGLDLLDDLVDGHGLTVVVLSGHGEQHHVERALRAGAAGYVLKGQPHEIAEALRAAAAGTRYLSPVLREPDQPTTAGSGRPAPQP